MRKLLFITALWKRRNIENITLAHFKRMKERFSDRVTIEGVAVGSEMAASERQATRHGFEYLEESNEWLGRKWNAVWNHAIQKDVDAIVIMGSDNLMTTKAIDTYIAWMEGGQDFLGYKGVHMLNPSQSKAIRLDGYIGSRSSETYGPGRAFSIATARKIGSSPFADRINQGLDGSFQQTLAKRAPKLDSLILPSLGFGKWFEVKSDINIWDIDDFISPHHKYNKLPYAECLDLIDDLKTKVDINRAML